MTSSVEATEVRCDEDSLWVALSDGRTLSAPLVWFPRLLNASQGAREKVRISTRGLHWERLDENIPVEGLLAGRRYQTQTRPGAKAA